MRAALMVRDEAAVVLRDLTVSYRGRVAVHRLSGQFRSGQATAVMGPNGAGKSSLLGALGGLLKGVDGELTLRPGLRVAYLAQVSTLDRSFPIRVRDAVAMGLWRRIGCFAGLKAEHEQVLQHALAAVGLAGFDRRWVSELSAGQVQRVLFARLMVQDAQLILLDEPFNAMDARTTADLLALLARWKGEGRTVLAVLHDIEQVRQHFDEVLILARKGVAWGPTASVLTPQHLDCARQMAEAWETSQMLCQAT
jgi:zinc/manganese transport system ATP-binding protein